MARKRPAGRSPKPPAERHRNLRGSKDSAEFGLNGQPAKKPLMPPEEEEVQGSESVNDPTSLPQAEEEVQEKADEEDEAEVAETVTNPSLPEKEGEEADVEESQSDQARDGIEATGAASGHTASRAFASVATDELVRGARADELAKRTEPSGRSLRSKVKGLAGEANKQPLPARRTPRTWSAADEIRILEALTAQEGAPDHVFYDSVLMLLDDKTRGRRDLKEKIRSLERRFRTDTAKGLLPSEDHECRIYELSKTLWSKAPQSKNYDAPSPSQRSSCKGKNVQVVPHKEGGGKGKNAQVVREEGGGESARVVPEQAREGGGGVGAASVRRNLSELSSLYPYLAEEVKGYGELMKTAFENISDDEALSLDARCKKQKVDRLNLEMHQAELTNMLLRTLLGKTN